MDFTGKVTIVTGGALGIGGGISRKFSEKGSKIVIADIDLDSSLENSEKIKNKWERNHRRKKIWDTASNCWNA